VARAFLLEGVAPKFRHIGLPDQLTKATFLITRQCSHRIIKQLASFEHLLMIAPLHANLSCRETGQPRA
jgi:hypothetical protein